MKKLCIHRAIFWYAFYQINKGLEVHYSFLHDQLDDFLGENYEKYFDMFNLIFSFYPSNDNQLSIYEPEFLDIAVQEYLLLMDDNTELLKIYNEVGFDKVNKIGELATLFCEYLMEKFKILKEVSSKIRQ